LLSQEQLEKALPHQKKSNLKLGQFLVREGYVSEAQIVDLVSNQLRLEKYRPDKFTIDVELANVLPADIAHKYQAAPLLKSGLLLTVAMIDPLDINALDTIEVHTNCEVEAVICTEQQLNQMLSSIYGTYAFDKRSAELSMREKIRDAIGPDAESLVHLFCVTDRRCFYDHLGESRFAVRDIVEDRDLEMDRNTLAVLIEIEVANVVDQVPRRSRKKALRAVEWYKPAFARSGDYISAGAATAAEQLFDAVLANEVMR